MKTISKRCQDELQLLISKCYDTEMVLISSDQFLRSERFKNYKMECASTYKELAKLILLAARADKADIKLDMEFSDSGEKSWIDFSILFENEDNYELIVSGHKAAIIHMRGILGNDSIPDNLSLLLHNGILRIEELIRKSQQWGNVGSDLLS